MCRGHQHPDVSSESRVLYVDADPATAEAVRESLEADGRSVATAVDAEAGLERLEAAEPPGFDCVVSALDLPDTDGVEFLRSVRSEYPSVSGKSSAETTQSKPGGSAASSRSSPASASTAVATDRPSASSDSRTASAVAGSASTYSTRDSLDTSGCWCPRHMKVLP